MDSKFLFSFPNFHRTRTHNVLKSKCLPNFKDIAKSSKRQTFTCKSICQRITSKLTPVTQSVQIGKKAYYTIIKVYWSDDKNQLIIDSLKPAIKQAQEQPIAHDNSASIGGTLFGSALSIFSDPLDNTADDPNENLEQDRFRQQPTKKIKRKVRW